MQKSSLFIVITFVVLIFLFSQVSLLNNFSYIFQAKIILVLSLSISVLTRVDVPAQKKNTINKKRIKYKLTTLILIYLILIVFSFIMASLFNESSYFDFSIDALIALPIYLIIMCIWTVYVDRKQDNPEDIYFNFGRDLYAGNIKLKKYKVLILSTCIKMLFIPLMYAFSIKSISIVLNFNNILENPLFFINYLFFFGICIDVTIALGGYLFSSTLLNNEVISVDDSWLGWLVCLICYPPFVIIYRFFTEQVDNYIWSDWLRMDTPLYWLWAFLITITWITYWFSTFNLGFKFSNLSWRGLVNTGLYRYMRHPAYFSKNVYWWLHTVPFFGVMGLDMLRNFLALSFVSLIYYLRAKTEEKHLLKFKEYQEYYTWIEKNGLWAKIKKKFKKL